MQNPGDTDASDELPPFSALSATMRPTPVTLPHPNLAVNFAHRQWVFVPMHRHNLAAGIRLWRGAMDFSLA
jgi:hypothetical protein